MTNKLIVYDNPKPSWYNDIAKSTLINASYRVVSVTSIDSGLRIIYENSEGNNDFFVVDNETQIEIRSGYLQWQLDLGDKIQHYSLKLA